jgi:predicted PurR-regulated permease PerM
MNQEHGPPHVYTIAAALLAIAAGLYCVRLIYEPVIAPILDVLPPFTIALVIAFLLDPLVDFLGKRQIPRGIAVMMVGLAFLIVFVLVSALLVPKIISQASMLADNFPEYVKSIRMAIDDFLEHNKSMLERLHLPSTSGDWVRRFSAQLESIGKSTLNIVASSLSGAASRFLWVIIIPLGTLWFLKDFDYIKAKVVYFTPDSHQERLRHIGSAVGQVFSKYVRGMLTVAVLYSVTASIVLTLADLQYGLIIGALSGLLYMVPYIGVLITVLATGIAAMVQPGHSLAYVVGLMAWIGVQSFVIFDQLVVPKIVRGSVGVHPLVTLFSLALGARLFGFAGLVLAVPVVAAAQVALAYYYPKINDPLYVGKPDREEEHSLPPDQPKS